MTLLAYKTNTTYYYPTISTNSNGTTESEGPILSLAVTRPTVTWDLSSTPAFNITSTSADIRFDVKPK